MTELTEIFTKVDETIGLCESLIGEEQLNQIASLENEIESLKRMLAQKDKEIEELRAAAEQREDKILDGVVERISGEFGETRELKEISTITDTETKAVKLFDYAIGMQDAKLIGRLGSYLKGHVEFLIRLTESPELQSLFMVSSNTGSTFLPETTRLLISEQVARTSQFLNDIKSLAPSPFGTIDEEINIDFVARNKEIDEFLNNKELSITELESLLLQEIAVSSILRKMLAQKRPPIDETELVTVYSHLEDFLNKKHKDYSAPRLGKMIDRLVAMILQLRADLSESAKAKTVVETSSNIDEWLMWAVRLYRALSGIESPTEEPKTLRMMIEEAAFTTVGLTMPRFNTVHKDANFK